MSTDPYPDHGDGQASGGHREISAQVHSVIAAAERAAEAIREDAEAQAQIHLGDAQERAHRLLAERLQLIGELADDLLAQNSRSRAVGDVAPAARSGDRHHRGAARGGTGAAQPAPDPLQTRQRCCARLSLRSPANRASRSRRRSPRSSRSTPSRCSPGCGTGLSRPSPSLVPGR